MEEHTSRSKALAHVVAVNMGYGHERAAFALRQFASGGEVIVANDYEGISARERRFWNAGKSFYEFVSRLFRVLRMYRSGLRFSTVTCFFCCFLF